MPKLKSQSENMLGLCGYVLRHGPSAGEVRPAIIVKALGLDFVALQVFTASGDDLPNIWPTQAVYNANKEPGTWHRLEGKGK